jgi:hypothetical protein
MFIESDSKTTDVASAAAVRLFVIVPPHNLKFQHQEKIMLKEIFWLFSNSMR